MLAGAEASRLTCESWHLFPTLFSDTWQSWENLHHGNGEMTQVRTPFLPWSESHSSTKCWHWTEHLAHTCEMQTAVLTSTCGIGIKLRVHMRKGQQQTRALPA